MLMRINRYFFFVFLLIISTSLMSNQESFSLLNMIEPYKNSYIKTDDPNLTLRAFDLSTGSTSAAILSLLMASTLISSNGEAIDWHPSGKWLAAGGNVALAGRGAIFDFSSGHTALFHLNPLNILNHGDTIRAIDWHPSGNYIAHGGSLASGSGRVDFFDVTTGLKTNLSSTAFIIHGERVKRIRWSPDGKYLLSAGIGLGSIDHVVTYSFDGHSVWRLSDACCTYTYGAGELEGASWHPSGDYIAFGGTSAGPTAITTQVYYFNKQAQSAHLLPACNVSHGASVESVEWSPDGQYLLTAGNQINNINLRVYAFNGHSLILTSSIHHGSTGSTRRTRATWSPDGAFIASGSANEAVLRFFSFLDKKLNEVENAATLSSIGDLSWSHDGAFIGLMKKSAATNLDILRFTEPIDLILKKQKKELIKVKKMFASTSAALPQLYETAISTSALIDSTINYSIASLTTVTSFLIAGITAATQPSFDWHPSKDMVAVSSANNLYIYYYDTVALRQVATAVTTQPIATTIPQWDVKFSPRGDYVISGGWRDYIHSFDGYNLTELSSKYDHLFNGIEWDKSGAFIFCCEQRVTSTTTTNDPGRLSAYYFDGSSLTKMTSTGDTEYSTQMSINYNNRLVAKGGNKGKVNIYAFDPMATNTLTFVQSLNALTTSFSTVLFHPTQDILFVNTATQIRAFSINGTFTSELTGCQVSAAGALFLNFDSTGKFLLVSFSDKFIVFKFDGATLSAVIRYSSGSDVLTGAKWASDGQKIGLLVDTGTTVFLRILKVNFNSLSDSKPDLLLETSQSAITIDNKIKLIVQNSYAAVSLSDLNVATSNSIIQSTALTVNTSNALAGLLVRTSQGANALLVPSSQAIVSINTLSTANSFAVRALSPLDVQNSNAVVTYQPLIISTSNAVAGLLRATSNAIAGLLADTSDAVAGLLVSTSQAANATAIKAARLDTIDTGPSNIHFNSASITMTYNLNLSIDHQLFVHASGVVNGNGHSITFARGTGTQLTVDPSITTTFQNVIFKDYNEQATSLGAGASLIFGNNSRVEISEPQSLLRTWSFAGISQLNGLGNALTLGTGPRFLSTLISSSLQLSNLKLLNVRENNIRAANNNAQVFFQDVVLNMSADFTYSIGSMLIQNDVTIRGTSTFNYTTIMGCTVSPASQLTIDPGTRFNYAPAGNFRNLLSLTDSSATIYFNNGSLVATATGARLTKGTLLVDGIMNIQSGAISTAQAIVFGDGIPANDLTVKLYPGADIRLSKGFLNYANAN